MKRRLNRAFLLVPMAGLLVSAVTSASQPLSAGAAAPVMTKVEKRLYIGVGPDQFSTQTSGAALSAASRPTSPLSNFMPTSSGGPQCGLSLGSNVKVNQGCLNITATSLQGRGQAHNETAIAVNPFNARQLVAASNDYTLGDGHSPCNGTDDFTDIFVLQTPPPSGSNTGPSPTAVYCEQNTFFFDPAASARWAADRR